MSSRLPTIGDRREFFSWTLERLPDRRIKGTGPNGVNFYAESYEEAKKRMQTADVRSDDR